MLILRFGFRIVLVITTTIIAFSAMLAWISMTRLDYWNLVIARAIYGIGSETQMIAGSNMINAWFENDWLAGAYGIAYGFQLSGQALNQFATPKLAK